MKAPSISLWLIDNPCNRLAASDTANVALAGQTLDATLWDRCNWCLLLPFHRHNVNLEYIPLTTREILQSCIQTDIHISESRGPSCARERKGEGIEKKSEKERPLCLAGTNRSTTTPNHSCGQRCRRRQRRQHKNAPPAGITTPLSLSDPHPPPLAHAAVTFVLTLLVVLRHQLSRSLCQSVRQSIFFCFLSRKCVCSVFDSVCVCPCTRCAFYQSHSSVKFEISLEVSKKALTQRHLS